jgi:hypothetical protein
MPINDLRIQCNVLRAQLGLNKQGSCKFLAARLGCNRNSLNMALSGFRDGPSSEQLLQVLKQELEKIQQDRATLPSVVNG